MINRYFSSSKQILHAVSGSKQVTRSTKVRLVRALVWSVVTYGSEGWIIHKAEEKQIEAFEMWCYRRVLRVSWIDHRTNEWVLSRLEVEKSLLARIRTLKLSYYGHIMRKANCLEKDIIQGCVPGSRGRGRPRRRWKEDISDWTGLRINDAARSAEDRESWRSVIRAANPSTGGRQ